MGSCIAPVMCFPPAVHQDIFCPALQTLGAQILVTLLLVMPSQADLNPCAEVTGVKSLCVCICWGATETGCRRKHEAGVVQGEEKRFVISRREQMGLVVMPIFISNVNIPTSTSVIHNTT